MCTDFQIRFFQNWLTCRLLLPVGFGFRPTDFELVNHYLWRKIDQMLEPIDHILVPEFVDVYSCDPRHLAGKTLWQSGESVWYFFSSEKFKASPGRRQRITEHGAWLMTEQERDVTAALTSLKPSVVIGKKRTLIFYPRGAGRDTRVVWAIHEYTLCTNHQDDYVLCRLMKRPVEMHHNSHNNNTSSSNNFQVENTNADQTSRLHREQVTELNKPALPSLHH